VTPPPAPVTVVPKPKPKPKVAPQRRPAKAAAPAKLNSKKPRAVAAAVPTPVVDVGADNGASTKWMLVALLTGAIAILGLAAAPRRAFPQPVARVVVPKRLEIAFVGLALVAGVGISMLLAAALS
jgi:hypothetical protein